MMCGTLGAWFRATTYMLAAVLLVLALPARLEARRKSPAAIYLPAAAGVGVFVLVMHLWGWAAGPHPSHTSPRPSIRVAPSELDFGRLQVGASADGAVSVTNRRGWAISPSFSLSGECFALVALPEGGMEIPGLAKAQVVVRFKPESPGRCSGILRVSAIGPPVRGESHSVVVDVRLRGNAFSRP